MPKMTVHKIEMLIYDLNERPAWLHVEQLERVQDLGHFKIVYNEPQTVVIDNWSEKHPLNWRETIPEAVKKIFK